LGYHYGPEIEKFMVVDVEEIIAGLGQIVV
jgi:hypothetical protein